MNIEMQTGLEKSYADEMIALVNEQGGSEASEAYIRGYEDGYDQACMDLTDDDLGSCRDDQKPDSTGSPIGDYRDGVGAWQTDCPWK